MENYHYSLGPARAQAREPAGEGYNPVLLVRERKPREGVRRQRCKGTDLMGGERRP